MRAKKSLGQNFLHNKKILEEIVRIGEISKNDTILEVGPGHGELTELLGESAKNVIAIEKDRELVPLLKEKFKNNKNIEIREGDVLKISNFKFLISNQAKNPNFKIIANIPYYITSRFLKNSLTAKNKPELIVLMVQYEVAKRISACAPDMNLLALSAQAYGDVKFIKKVSRGNFNPAPKVDSAIIKISNISDKFFVQNKIKESNFFEVARRAFQQKRKMLRHSLFLTSEHFGTKRPEELYLDDWVVITRLSTN